MTAPSTSTRRALAGPASVAAAAATAAATLYVRDPRTSSYLPCPIHAVTGLWCPGCGATRAFGALVHGDIVSALSSNALTVVLGVIGVVIWAVWAIARVRGRSLSLRRPSAAVFAAGVLVVLAFTVWRNIPAGSWLAP